MSKKKQNIFIHDKDEIVYNRVVNGNKLTRSVEGYNEPCKTCNEYPSFQFDSKKPDKLYVYCCEHTTVKVEKAHKYY